MSESGIVDIRGKAYKTVAKRVDEFRNDYKSDYSIETKVLSAAELVMVRAVIKNEEGRIVATGHGEENRNFGNINKTSAIENCETSAIGRALASLGYGGSEFCSADELADAMAQQDASKVVEPLLKHNAAVRDNLPSVFAIKQGIAEGDLSAASEAWGELDKDTKMALWVAPTKGGIFTTAERDIMKSTEFRTANGSGSDE